MKKRYAILAVVALLFGLLIFDSHGFGSSFVRYYVGDFIAIVFVYGFASMFWRAHYAWRAFATFAFAMFLETIQYTGVLRPLVRATRPIGDFVLGATFDWKDVVAYGVAAMAIIVVEAIARALARKRTMR